VEEAGRKGGERYGSTTALEAFICLYLFHEVLYIFFLYVHSLRFFFFGLEVYLWTYLGDLVVFTG